MKIKNQLNRNVGANIKAWREIRGVKQEWMAAKIGLCKSSLSQIENGKTEIPITRLSEIAVILEIKLSDLFECPYEKLNQSTIKKLHVMVSGSLQFTR